MKYYNVDKWE